jgi:hypothetical protein
MKFSSLLIASAAMLPMLAVSPAQAATFTQSITFNETGLPGFPSATTTIAGPSGSGSTPYDVD